MCALVVGTQMTRKTRFKYYGAGALSWSRWDSKEYLRTLGSHRPPCGAPRRRPGPCACRSPCGPQTWRGPAGACTPCAAEGPSAPRAPPAPATGNNTSHTISTKYA
eukprot:388491-Pyramimonas_sp.AAC.2